jgi:GntR family transcriptional regulator, transcriptional repressor for pyruvate dehydrogenase complex
MNIKPVQNKSLVSAVIDEIINQIQIGNLKPGDKLDSQSILAQKFDVGLNCIREAIQALFLANIVNIRPGKGVYISELSIKSLINPTKINLPVSQRNIKEYVDAWNVRILLECGSVEMIIQNINEEKILELKNVLENMNNYARENRNDLLSFTDLRFHRSLINITNNEVLIHVFQFISEILLEGFNIKKSNVRISNRALTEHKEIFEAIKLKDKEMLNSMIKKHLLNSKADILELYNSQNVKID